MTTHTHPTVLLGDGLRSSVQGFGGMALSDSYGEADPEQSLATLHRAVDLGVTLIDTADVYGHGGNERLIARLLHDRRDEVTLATKFGFTPSDAQGYRVRGDAEYVRSSVQASLERLRTDRIDLYYYHRVDQRVPIEETVEALAGLVREGLVRHIGLSEVTASELERAQSVHPIGAVQSEWSIWSRDVEEFVIPTAARLGVGFFAYSPLGRGFLAGHSGTDLADGDNRRNFPRFDEEHLATNRAIRDAVQRLAETEQVTPAQLALAWIYQRGRVLGIPVVPIPSTRRAERVAENLAATSVQLAPATIEELDGLAELVVGDRARDAGSISQGRERAEHEATEAGRR